MFEAKGDSRPMQITDLLVPERVALNMQVADKAMAIHAMVGMLDRTGCLRDAVEYEKNVLEREAQGTTGVGGGVAIPHGKSNAVRVPALAAVTLREAIDYQALDGAPVRLLFLIAAPDGANDLHIQVLARLAQLLMEPLFCEELKQAATPEEFLAVIAKREQGETAREARAEAVAEAALTEPRLAPRVLAVTACPTGIAHTYMAAEALEAEAAEMHIAIKVETNGADGVKNHLTEQEIENAECIIVAADKAVETARFAGKPVLRVPVSQALKDPEMLLHRALSGTAPLEPEDESVPGMGCNRKAGSAKDGAAATQEFGRKLYTDLMNGVSHMIPFITGGGILIALSYFLDRGNAGAEMFGRGTSLAMLVRTIGNTSFNLMYVVLAGFIAMSVGDLPALVAGMAGGMLAIQGTSLAPQTEWVSSGFWGAMIAGFAAGLVVKLLRTAFKRLPSALGHIKTVLLYPVASLAVVGFMMVFLVNAPLGRFNTWIYQLLASMQGGSRVVMAAVLGALMAVDFGGPINKAAYLFGTVALAGGQEEFMAAVMAGGMVPPLGVALAGTLFPERFTTKERHTAMTDYLMGACFITEGVVPFVLRDPLHVIPSCMAGASLAAALSMLFGCAVPAPHGGMFLLPLNPHPFRYLLALLMGSLLTAVTLAVLRRKYPPKDEEQPTN